MEKGLQGLVCTRSNELSGSVKISGSKNVGLKLLLASPMMSKPFRLTRVPRNSQVRYVIQLLTSFGVDVQITSDSLDEGYTLTISANELKRTEFEDQEIRWCRHAFLMAIAVLLRTGSVIVPLPGYSHYGHRPVIGQLDGLKQMGALFSGPHNGKIRIDMPESRRFGKDVFLPFPSNAITEALLLAAIATKGKTTIHGAAQEPETLALADFFGKCGAEFEGLGSNRIIVKSAGVESLTAPVSHEVIPDRIEVATLGAILAVCKGEIELRGINPKHLAAVRATLSHIGVGIEEVEGAWNLQMDRRPQKTNITTGPYPAFPTDALGPYLTALGMADGISVLNERMWTNRLALAMELGKMGANIDVTNGQIAIINGMEKLEGTTMFGTDPRATAALVGAGLVANGETMVIGVDLMDNAYDALDEKLQNLGGNVRRAEISKEKNLPHPEFGRLEAF